MSDKIDDFIKQIALAYNRNIEGDLYDAIRDDLENAGVQVAKETVEEIISISSLPRNIFGLVHNTVLEKKRVRDKREMNQDHWTAKEDCVTPEEWRGYFHCVALMIKLAKAGRIQYIQMCKSLNHGWEMACKANQTIDYLTRFLKMLKDK